MASLRQPRVGRTLRIKERELDFSFFPVAYRNRGWTLSDTVFAVSPWAVMQGAINQRLSDEHQAEATAFLQQAQDFYVTASERLSANPLLFYYAFLNLGKALLRVRGLGDSLDHAHHGLSEVRPAAVPLDEAQLKVRSGGEEVSVFPSLVRALGYIEPPNNTELPVRELLGQVVIGHRQWRDATGQAERFIGLKEMEFVHDRDAQATWLRIYVDPSDLSRYGITLSRVLNEGELRGAFHAVNSPLPGFYCFEQIDPTIYTTDPADCLQGLVDRVRSVFWRIVSSLPGSGYRRYYLHLTPLGEDHRIPQVASLWAIFFCFGSMVRYRPHLFDELAAGPYGPFVNEFVSAQPEQLLYLLASEMCLREVAKPAIA